MKRRIETDEGLILAAERNSNGANVHKIGNLVDCYKMACWSGNQEAALRSSSQLKEVLRNNIKVVEPTGETVMIRCAICYNPTLPKIGQKYAICGRCAKKELGLGYMRAAP